MSQQSIRDTQRIPRSCTECSRRKIKCSKTIPCTGCVRRGEGLSCTRELVRVNGKVTIAVDAKTAPGITSEDQLRNENVGLQARIQHLEALLQQAEAKPIEFSESTISSINPKGENQPPADIISAFDDLHMNGSSETRPQRPTVASESRKEELLSLLPIRKSSEKIILFSLGALGWVHCALNAPLFIDQHEAFWNSLNSKNVEVLQDHSWMALYLSVLSVGAYFMDENDCLDIHYIHEGLSGNRRPAVISEGDDIFAISHAWYEAVFKELNYADFLGKPNLATVQTLAILSLVHRNFGEAQREYTLLGVAINTARMLGLDRLGHEGQPGRHLSNAPHWAERKHRVLGRRLWWTLVICDWMKVSRSDCSINPKSFNSTLSIESDSSHHDIIFNEASTECNGQTVPPPLAYHMLAAKMARILHNYCSTNAEVSDKRVPKAIQSIDLLVRGLPQHLSQDLVFSQVEDAWPTWVHCQRSQTALLLNVCRINLCISLLPQIVETKEDKFCLQRCGRHAANAILRTRQNDPASYFKKFWGVRCSTLAAGIYLALDLMCFAVEKSPAEIEEQLQSIDFCIEILQDGNEALKEGPLTLRRLVHLFHSCVPGQVVDGNTLLGVMKMAATPFDPSTTAFGAGNELPLHFNWFFNPTERESNNQTTGIPTYDNVGTESYSTRGIGSTDMNYTMDFDGVDFDIGPSIPGIDVEWTGNTLFDLFPGEHITTPL